MSRVRTVAATEVLLVVGLVAFVLVIHLLERGLGLEGPVRLPRLGAMAVSAIPGVLWLSYFYVQDRHEPEPKHFVTGIFALGALVAGPAAGFLIDLVEPRTPGSVALTPFAPARVVWALLVVAVVQEVCKYATVRYTVYMSHEFDEPMDGIVYMTAAGIGFATYQNYLYLQGLDGVVFLTAGAANAVVTTLAHACFAAVLGYALGRAKFEAGSVTRRGLTLGLGLAVAAVLNGQFFLLQSAVRTTGLDVQPWRGVAYAAGFAAVVFFATSHLMRRHLASSPHAPAEP